MCWYFFRILYYNDQAKILSTNVGGILALFALSECLSCDLHNIVVQPQGNGSAAMKGATVSARVACDVKTQTEDILQRLGIPVPVVIHSL